MVLVPKGRFQPFFKEQNDQSIIVKSFYLDQFPVSNKDFNEFLLQNPQYQKSKIVSIFADQSYLQDWRADLLSKQDLKNKGFLPLTSVSWFVARKYCQFKNQRLPTIAEWEYAAESTNPEVMNLLLIWYAKNGDQRLEKIGQGKPNKFGVHDLHGLIWEWVEDFNAVMISSDSRTKGDRTDGLFCGGGSVNSKDSNAYATFMRYAFRSGLRGDYCIKNLGFRCASDKKENKK